MATYSLITLDGKLVLDDEAQTITLGAEPAVSAVGATAVMETAGELSRRITASRILLTGVFALAWRKKKDDRELFVTIQTTETTPAGSGRPEARRTEQAVRGRRERCRSRSSGA